MEWEDFHNKYIKMFKPECVSCGDLCYRSEGFVVKIDGKIGCFCSAACQEESDLQEDTDWCIWKMHPPESLLEGY